MQFDEHGHLTPYAVLETSLADFEAVFVTNFPDSQTRGRIFGRHVAYVEELQRIVGSGFYQWIGGSFVTRKQNPRDIDFVTFLNADVFKSHEQRIEELRQRRYLPNTLTDGYFVNVYPEGHRRRSWYELDRLRWQHDFGTSLAKRPKGIVQLNF